MAYDYTSVIWSTAATVAANETAFRCSATTANAKVSLLGKATSTTVMNAGSMTVSSGGTATSSFLNGGKMMVYGHGLAAYTTVNSGGIAYVYNAGKVNFTTVASGGTLRISAGASAANTTVEIGGRAYISGGVVTDLDNTGIVYTYGGKLTGTVNLRNTNAGNGVIYVKGNTEINFNVANDADGSTALFTNYNQVKFTDGYSASNLNFTVTVNNGKQDGSYVLATQATGIAGNALTFYTINNTASIGTLTVADGASFTVSDTSIGLNVNYALRYSGKTLILDITNESTAAVVTNMDDLGLAIEANPIKIKVTATGTWYAAASFNGIETEINAGEYTSRVVGGVSDTGTVKDNTPTNLTITGGTFLSLVAGGDRLIEASGTATHTGAITTTITGGEFHMAVGGGMMHDMSVTNKGIVTQNGDVNLTISGGTFSHQVVGGNISAKTAAATSTRSIINGNVNVTLDSSDSVLNFGRSVIGGSWGKGTINGDVNMTLTGNKAINITEDLWGACSQDTYAAERANRGYRALNTKISGDRTLTFSGFNATLTCDAIGGFNRLVTEHASKVEIKQNQDAPVDSIFALGDIRTWEIGYGSQIKGDFANNFTGDTLVLGSAQNASQMSGTWNVFVNANEDGKAYVGFAGIGSVTLFGETATDFIAGSWVSDSYKLSISGNYMQVTTLA